MKIFKDALEAVAKVPKVSSLFLQGGDATPIVLLKALLSDYDRLEEITVCHLHTHGEADYTQKKYQDKFKVKNFFVAGNVRASVDFDVVDYIPCFLSEIPNLFRTGAYPLDVAFINVSPPDKHGYCTLGTSVDVARAAVDSANIVIAQINKRMPRVHGDGVIHVSRIDYGVEVDAPISSFKKTDLSVEEKKIGEKVASLIEDGSTIQVGIGAVPDAVLNNLKGHKNLGVHSEMWTHGMMDLIKSDVVNNSKKVINPGKTVSAFIIGGDEVHSFIDDNTSIIQKGSDYVNSPAMIKQNPKVCAINSAVEIDLTGQVCADSVGHRIISGVGGQMDFMRGAALSYKGKPIIAITSRSKKGFPKIVPALRLGAGVVTTRAHVHYVVTEYGIAYLYGKTIGERARALIEIAHPDDREDLFRAWSRIRASLLN